MLQPTDNNKDYTIDPNEFEMLDDQFVILFFRQIKIDASGLYAFYLVFNDGSKLFIDNELVIDTDGLNSFSGESGNVAFTAGTHDISLEYFHAGGAKD